MATERHQQIKRVDRYMNSKGMEHALASPNKKKGVKSPEIKIQAQRWDQQRERMFKTNYVPHYPTHRKRNIGVANGKMFYLK